MMSHKRRISRPEFFAAIFGLAFLLALVALPPKRNQAAVESRPQRESTERFASALTNPFSTTNPSRLAKTHNKTETTPSEKRAIITWQGGQHDHRWSNPDNWVGGHVPGAADLARFPAHSKSDASVDVESIGKIAGLEVERGYRGTITLERDLSVGEDLVIGDGNFKQGDYNLSVGRYRQSGGTFRGGSTKLTIDREATVSGGLLTTPSLMTAESLVIDSPGVVRMSANGKLELSGEGEPLSGSGLLDVTTQKPNSIEYTGAAKVDLTAARPAAQLHGMRHIARDEMISALEGPQEPDEKRPVTPQNFNRVGAIGLTRGDTYLECAVIDPAAGFAYFCAATNPGGVVKVRLSDFTRVGTLVLNPGEDSLGSAVIDPAGGFAYFGTITNPGIVIKVRLSDFTRVGGLTLNSGENFPRTAVIDPAGGFAYFGTNTTPGSVVKIRLSDFTRVGGLTLNTGENSLRSGVIDAAGGFAYFGTTTSPGIVVKVRLSDFTRVGSLTMNTGENSLRCAVIDVAGGFAYFGASLTVVKVRLSDLTRVGALSLNTGAGENSFRSAAIDTAGGFAYFASYTFPQSVVIKVRLSDFTRVATLNLNPGENFIFAAVIDPAGGFAYFGTDTSPGRVLKVRLSDFTRTGVLRLAPGEDALLSAVIDTAGGFAYFGTYSEPGIIIKVRLSDFTRVGALTLNSGEDDLYSAVIDPAGGFAYFGTDTFPGIVVKIRLSDFTRVGSLTMNSGEDELGAAVIDPAAGFAYFCSFFSFPAAIVKIRLSDFTRVGALALPQNDGVVTSAVIDPAGGFAYFGAGFLGNGGHVIKVRLSDFTRVSALGLNPAEDFLFTAVIDPAAGFAYFGNQNTGSIVVKVRLSDLTRVGAVTFNPGEDFLYTSVIDPAGGFAYFGTLTAPGIVVKVRLSDLTRVGALTLNPNELGVSAAVIDPGQSFAYFGTDTAPAFVVKVDISDVSAPTVTSVSSSINPSDFGQSVTFTATVTSTRGTPTGTVQFKDNSSNIGAPVALNASGVAQLTTSSLTAGTHTITVEYSGDANFLASTGTLAGGQVVKVQPTLSINDVSIIEGDTGTKTLNFTVILSAASNLIVNANFATANGTATAPSDYVATNGLLTFNPGDLVRTIGVTINGDTSFEPNETFTVNLSTPVNATISRAQGTGTILNDDAQGGFVAFSQSTYSVSESTGFLTIAVNRTNDTTRAATIDYATDDTGAPATCATVNGLASARCDFTTALGTLRFAAGETQKTFTVLVNRDSYLEGSEFFSLNLSNPTGGAMFIAPSSAMVTITDSATGPPPNLIDDASFFVRQNYHDFLNREADASGLAFWTGEITGCGSNPQCIESKRVNVSAAFFLSIEFQETGGTAYFSNKVAFGTVPTYSRFERDSQALGRDYIFTAPGSAALLEANKVAYFNEVITRPEFVAIYGALLNGPYVDALITNTGVTFTTAERDALVNGLNNSTETRATVLRKISEKGSFRQAEMNRMFVLLEYFGYLRRNPSDPPDNNLNGFNFWLTKLNQFNGNFVNAEMVKAFITSVEYRNRFGP